MIDAKPDVLPAITISPMTSDFGSVTIGQTSQPTSFTVTNGGDGTSDQIQVTLSGSSDYHLVSNTCQSLAPAATCTIGVTLAPTATGTRTATLLVNTTGSSASSALTGIGGSPSSLAVSPSTFSFASAVVGTPGTDTDTITVTNNGGQTTAALTVQATGNDPSQFTKGSDTCNGQTLAAGASCAIAVKFTPTTGGNKAASFTILAGTSSAVAAFSGTAATPAALAIAPTTQNFGSVVQGQTSSTVTINVANTGGSPTGALTTGVSGTNANSFAVVTSSCNTVLAASSTCQVLLRYTPSLIGAESATLTVKGTPGGTVTTALSGTGINAGQLSIDPTTFAYAATLVGATSTTSTFTLTNGGGTAAGPVVVNLSGTDANQFHIVGGADNCTSTTIQPGGKCTVGIAFSPSSLGTKSATVIASANGNSVTSALSGAGVPAPQLVLSPSTKDFGSNGIGTTSAAATFTLSNSGGAPTTVPTIAISGTNANQFAQTNNCATALAPAGSCTISVTFSPTAAGLDSAVLTASAATGGSVSGNLFGSGSNPAQISVLPGSLSFPQTTVGDQSTQTFTIQNNGSTTTGTVGIAITSGGLVQFTQSSNCTTLAPGATCTVTVAYAPSVAGSATATATVTATPGGTATVALAGSSVSRLELVSINGAPASLPYDFGDVFVGVEKDAAFTVRNNTNQTQTATGNYNTGSDPDFGIAGSNCNVNFLPHTECTFTLGLIPGTVGKKHATIFFSIGAGANNTIEGALVGNGIPSIIVTPVTTSDFGNIVVGQTSPSLSFKVTNTASVTVGPPAISTLNSPFVALQGTCNANLAAGASCIATATFKPTTLGPQTSSIVAKSNPGGTATLDITGTGVSATDLTLSPAPTAFGDVFAGTTKDISIVVTNPAGSQTSGKIHYAYTGATEFTVLNNNTAGDCVDNTTALANGTSCNVRIRFSPVAFDNSGSRALSGTLTVTANPGATAGITSVITGNAKSTLSIAPASFDFGTLFVPATATKTFTVHNDSPSAVVLGATTFGGSSTGLSVTASTCTGSLPSNADCTVTVKFAPTAATTDAATLTVPATNLFGRAVATINAIGTDILLDQLDSISGSSVDAYWSANASGTNATQADDFTMPAGGGTVFGIDVRFYLITTNGTFTLTFYNDNGGLPGSLIATRAGVTFTQSGPLFDARSSQSMTFPSVSLAAGKFWIGVTYIPNDGQPGYWTRSTSTNGAPAAVSSVSFCGTATFMSRANCPAYGGGPPDNAMRVHGAAVVGPAHESFIQVTKPVMSAAVMRPRAFSATPN